MANNVVKNNKCFVPIENAVNAFVDNDVNINTPLSSIFNDAKTGITMYKIVGTSDTSIYPVVVPVAAQSSNGAVITLVKVAGVGVFIFEYDGDVYISPAYSRRGGVTVDGWYKVTTTAV
mgnify:CR=1 FL=1